MSMSPRLLRPRDTAFTPRSISGLALWLDASSSDLYTTDAGPVTAVASPLDIAGCQLWLDASDPASITASGGEVTAWADKSTTGSSWTRVSGTNGPATGTQTIGGKNVIVFDGTNDGLSAVTPLNTSMPLTFFVVQRVVSGTVAGMTYTAGTGDNFNLRQAADTLGTLEVTAGGSLMQLGGALLSQNTLYSLTVPTSSNASIYRDGTVVSISTNAALKPTLTGTHYLGRRSDGFYGNVQIAEIVAYSAELTTAQRASVEAYLASKWAISGVHRSASQEIAAVTSPTEMGGCVGWWDGADASSVTRDGSNLVSQWSDKSGNGRHLTQSDAARKPTYSTAAVNGLNAIVWPTTANGCQLDYLAAFTHQTVIVVCRYADGVSAGFGGTQGLLTSSSALGLLISGTTWYGAHPFATSFNFVRINGAAPVRVDGTTAIPMPLRILTCRRDTPATQALIIGSERNQAARGWSGPICEVIAFDRELTTNEALRVEKYLQQKWATPTVPDPTPPVGYWGDRSGNGRHAVQATAGSRPVVGTQNSRKALTFDGVNDNLNNTPSSVVGADAVTFIAAIKHNLTSQPTYLGPPVDLSSGNGGRPITRWQSASQNQMFVGLTLGNVASEYRSQADRFIYCFDGRKDNAGSGTHTLREFFNGSTVTSADITATWSTASQKFNVGSRDDNETQYKGDICELMCYNRALTTAERQRVERYLGSRWGITLAPQVSNADAQDWVNRVYSNGGAVSTATAAAVNTLCDSLESASLRDRFYRMNLFCGGTSGTAVGLNSALVPLYRGPSLGGTQYGGTTDTNFGGLFVPANYSESGGLVGDGSTKYLKTGLASNQLAGGLTGHAALWRGTGTVASTRIALGGSDSDVDDFEIQERSGSTDGAWGKTTFIGSAPANVSGLKMINRSSSTRLDLYSNGSSIVNSTASVVVAPHANEFYVFGGNRNGTLTGPVAFPVFAYSLGVSMDATQATNYYNALAAFQTSMSRT